ncbi:response regulator [Labilibacter sediminis]|nr:response regulator [Labilibacter sediminis]
MKSYYIFILYMLFVHLQCYVSAQSTYNFSSITKGSNLYAGNIDGLLKDSNGYIWYHSHGRLFQFDGEDWNSVETPVEAKGIKGNVTLHGTLVEDHWNNLWLGNNNGLFYYKSKVGSMESIRGLLHEDSKFPMDISHVIVYSEHKILFLADQQLFELDYDYNEQTNQMTVISLQKILSDDLSPYFLMTRLKSGNMGLLSNSTFVEYNPETRVLERKQLSIPLKLGTSPGNPPVVYYDNNGVLWIGAQLFGVYSYHLETGILKNYHSVQGKRIRIIKDITGDKDGNIWVASTEGLIRIWSINEKTHTEFIGTEKELDNLYLQYINSMYTDEEGFLLLVSHGGEIIKLEAQNSIYQFLPINKGFFVAPIYTPFSLIRMAPDGGLCKIMSSRFKSKVVSINPSNNEEDEVFTITKPGDRILDFEFQDAYLWIGSRISGLSIINPDLKEKVRNNTNQDLLDFFKDKPVARMIKLSDSLFYFIIETGQVYEVIRSSNGVWNWQKKEHKLQAFTLFATPVIGTSKKWVWFANPLSTLVGLGPNGETKEFVLKDDISISALSELPNGDLLLGSYGGLRSINLETGKIKYFNSFSDVSVFNIIPEDSTREVFWITSYKKVFRFNYSTGKVDVLASKNGLPNCRFQTNSSVRLKDGKIGFGTLRKGIMYFSPQDVEFTSKPLSVKISGVKVNGKPVSYISKSKKDPLLDYEFPFAQQIKLRHDQNLLSIRFSALNYTQPQNVRYTYFMEGLDKEWNNVGYAFNEVTYSNLNPGNYTFRVKATNTPGVWLGEESVFEIYVKPAWYQTQVAISAFIVIIILLMIFFWRFSFGKIKLKEQLKREKAERDKDNEMHKLRLQFFTNISHEFKTPLSLLFGPLKQLRTQQETLSHKDKERLFDLMSRNIQHLIKMINQLMDFRKVSNNAMKLRVRPTNISRFIEEQYLKFKQEVESQDKTILLENASDELIFGWVDSEKLLRILDNLLSNAVKFTPVNGVIRVIVQKENEGVVLQVCDNGVGIAPEHIPHIFQRYYRVEGDKDQTIQVPGTGIGLALSSELAKLMKGNISVESEVGKGSCFRFYFPIAATSFADEEKDEEKQNDENADESITRVAEDHGVELERNKPLVLIVEDNLDMQSFIASVLKNDYSLEFAGNGFEGIDKCDRLAPDLVVSDVMMPEMGGFEMVAKLKTDVRISHIPIVLLTALSSAKHQVKGMEAGADLYIPKPFDPEYFKISIGNLIKSRANLRQQFGKKLIDVKTSDITITKTDEVFLDNIMKIIGERLFEAEFKIEDLHTEVGMSRSQFFRKIKALTDQTAGEFVKSLRLKKAAELLVEQGIRVSDVCYEVGFTDPKYFGKVFRKYFGLSPTEYVKSKKT